MKGNCSRLNHRNQKEKKTKKTEVGSHGRKEEAGHAQFRNTSIW